MKNFSRTRSVPAVERPSLSRAFPAAGKLNVACCITVAGFVLALSGLCLLLRGQLAMGLFVLTLASVADLLDGFTARKLGLVSAYGQSLDSLSDTISFVAAPAVILMWFGHFRPIWVVAGLVYAVCGVLRLNYFEHNPAPGYFIGVSSPIASGLLIMPFYALTFLFRVEAGNTASPTRPSACAATSSRWRGWSSPCCNVKHRQAPRSECSGALYHEEAAGPVSSAKAT